MHTIEIYNSSYLKQQRTIKENKNNKIDDDEVEVEEKKLMNPSKSIFTFKRLN